MEVLFLFVPVALIIAQYALPVQQTATVRQPCRSRCS